MSYHNIEKHPTQPGDYIGYGGGSVWGVYRRGPRFWSAWVNPAKFPGSRHLSELITGRTLREVSAKLERVR